MVGTCLQHFHVSVYTSVAFWEMECDQAYCLCRFQFIVCIFVCAADCFVCVGSAAMGWMAFRLNCQIMSNSDESVMWDGAS